MAVSEKSASDVLAAYTRDVARYPVLTLAEEQALGHRAVAGDDDARQALVRHNLRFVIRIAKNFQHHGVPLLDLIQAGNIGLVHASTKFDPRVGVRFISYAVSWIRQLVLREIDGNDTSIRATQTQITRTRRVKRLQSQARQRLGRDLTVEEIRAETGYTENRIREALDYRITVQPLDSPISPNSDTTTTLAEVIGQADDSEERELTAARRSAINDLLGEILSERERQVLIEYFGLNDRRELSLAEIGCSRSISRERARQLKERAIQKLRDANPESLAALRDLFTTKQELEERVQPGVGKGAPRPSPSLPNLSEMPRPSTCPPVLGDAPQTRRVPSASVQQDLFEAPSNC
jgi:RNA polymerase primary sigma factor